MPTPISVPIDFLYILIVSSLVLLFESVIHFCKNQEYLAAALCAVLGSAALFGIVHLSFKIFYFTF